MDKTSTSWSWWSTMDKTSTSWIWWSTMDKTSTSWIWWSTWTKVATTTRTIFKLVGPCEILSRSKNVCLLSVSLSPLITLDGFWQNFLCVMPFRYKNSAHFTWEKLTFGYGYLHAAMQGKGDLWKSKNTIFCIQRLQGWNYFAKKSEKNENISEAKIVLVC